MAVSVLVSAWLVGTLGGLHCLSMCGGFMAAIAARDSSTGRGTAPLLPARAIMRQQLGYQAGRIATYMLLGAVFGAAGAAALEAADLLPIQRAMYVIANIFLLILGLSLATRTPGVGWLQRIGSRAFGRALPLLRPLLERPGSAGRITLGLVWGMVPCALVYSVLPLALFAGGAWQGAAVMLVFGLGTLPNLVTMGLVLDRTRPLFERATLRFGVASLLVAFAVVGIYRALYVPGALAQGPFCLLP
jgi:sulfite exporter TauE/SafE